MFYSCFHYRLVEHNVHLRKKYEQIPKGYDLSIWVQLVFRIVLGLGFPLTVQLKTYRNYLQPVLPVQAKNGLSLQLTSQSRETHIQISSGFSKKIHVERHCEPEN